VVGFGSLIMEVSWWALLLLETSGVKEVLPKNGWGFVHGNGANTKLGKR